MVKITRLAGLLAGAVFCVSSAAYAQAASPAAQKAFLNINVGGQLAPRTFGGTARVPNIYDEDATLSSTQPVNRALVVDFGGGMRVAGDIYAGVLISMFSDKETANVTVSIPDPLFYDRPKVSTTTADNLTRREIGIVPHAGYLISLGDKLDLAVSGGVAIVRLSQEFVGKLTLGTGQSYTTDTTTETGTGFGPYGGIDFIYSRTERLGLGLYARYAGAKVTILDVDQNVGGMQAGGGIRLRF